MKTIQKMILGLAISMGSFSATEGMERDRMHAEVERVLEKFHRNMAEYYQRTKAKKKKVPIMLKAGDRTKTTLATESFDFPTLTDLGLVTPNRALLSIPLTKNEAKLFKGNWTESFRLKNGEIASHTPQRVQFCSFISGKMFNNQGNMKYNGYSVGRFCIAVDSTREEFITALRASGLY